MEILPRTMGTRPRLACEVRAEGVVAARAGDASAVLDAVSRVTLAEGIVVSHLTVGEAGVTVASAAGNSAANGIVAGIGSGPAGRKTLVDAVRSVLEAVSVKGREVTLVVPDAAVRVLLLDFDELPAKEADALPVVRFRLKKLLPFDADDAAVSFQIMASGRSGIQVMAVAMPKQTLIEYESVVRDAGFEPGAVLPSTLAAVCGLGDGEMPMLVVNAGSESVTTAIVKGGVLLLHRTVDLAGDGDESTRESLVTPATRIEAEEPVETSIAAIAARMAAAAPQIPMTTTVPEIILETSLDAPTSEVARAVSVAAAYFEDTLGGSPAVALSAGPMGADTLIAMLDEGHVGTGPLAVQEIVERQMLAVGASSAGQPGGVPLGWLAGVRGALAN